jgi:phosphatidylglycerophosphatase A
LNKASLILWVAQGFGVGRIPLTPGSFGSLLGLLWVALLLWPGNFWLWLIGMTGGIGASIWLCDQAERLLQQTDPSSVVIDEIVAMPVCFAGWIALEWYRHGALPSPVAMLRPGAWPWVLALFVAFRFFDIVKPWPVKQSQALPGGWGVTADDLLAALYVNVIFLLLH